MSRWYYWISGLFLLDAMQAFSVIDRMVYGTWVGKTGDKITQSLNLLMLLTALALFGRGYRRWKNAAGGVILAFAAIAFLFISARWSLDSGATLRQASQYLIAVIGFIGLAGTLDADEFMDLLGLTCFLSAIASVVLRIVSPANATVLMGGAEADFVGIFPHKNFLGQVMVAGGLASLHSIRIGGRRLVRNLFMLFVFVGMAFASKSATSWVTILFFCGADGIIALCRKGGAARALGIFLSIIILPTLIVIAADPDPFLELIGKDPTLTGRTVIWAFAIDCIWLKPFLGWGFYGFWSPFNPLANLFSESEHWNVPQAHNGLLEMLLELGVVGSAIFIFLFIRNVIKAFQCLRTPATALAITTIMSCAGILLIGISEPVLLNYSQSSTLLFFTTGLMCELAVQAKKKRRYRANASQLCAVPTTNKSADQNARQGASSLTPR